MGEGLVVLIAGQRLGSWNVSGLKRELGEFGFDLGFKEQPVSSPPIYIARKLDGSLIEYDVIPICCFEHCAEIVIGKIVHTVLVGQVLDVETTESTYKAIVERVREHLPDAKLYLLNTR